MRNLSFTALHCLVCILYVCRAATNATVSILSSIHSRLQNNNNALNAQITELKASSTLSTSSTAPLQFENTRLRTELDSLNAHCKWLEDELNTRTSQTAELKINQSKTVHELRNELNAVKTDRDELSSHASSLKMSCDSFRKRLESSQKMLLEKEQDHADTVHELNLEIQTERRLVSLQKQNVGRLEERYNDVAREMGSMKSLAAAAEEEHSQDILALKAEAEQQFRTLLGQAEQENEGRIVEYQKQLHDAMVEKAQLEDEFMAGGSRAIVGAQQLMQLTNTPDDREPITLTKLYEKLADAEDDTRQERAERRRLELYLERVHKDIESAAPRQRQERKEFELAMAQSQEMHSRLNEAWEESNGARRELQQIQRELNETTRECHELRLENSDMAKQVQTLLQKSLGGEDLGAEIQDQNQRLLKEHHRMSTTISELQEQLDTDTVQQKLQEFEAMKEERTNQAALVSNIIQQRDLYRALLVKNDASLLTEYGADGAIVAAKDQIEKYAEVESKNKELVEAVSKLNADLASVTNEKIGVEQRFARSDAYANEVSTTNAQLQSDLSAVHAANARSNAEAEFHMQKVGRLEEALGVARNDLNRANDDKKGLQRLSEELQSALSVTMDQQSKIEEELRQATVQMRLAEANGKSLKDTESRLTAENSSLRSELARHTVLQESMQKIEASLSTRGAQEQNRLEDEVNKLTSTLSSERSQYNLNVEKLQNQLADEELRISDANKKTAEALATVIKVQDDLVRAIADTTSLTDRCASLETSLKAAMIKLGLNDGDTSDQEKIETLAHDLEVAKTELQAANKKVEDYKTMSKASENTLIDATTASGEFEKSTTAEIQRLKEELKLVTDTSTARQEAFEELTAGLSTSRGEHEKVVDELKANINAMKTELQTSKTDQISTESQRDNTMQEMNVYKSEARAAKDNYERELALHADARKELQATRGKAESEARLHQNTMSQLNNFNDETARERRAWDESKDRLQEAQKHAEARLAESQEQNKILHSQLAALHETVEKIQTEKVSAVVDSAGEAGETSILAEDSASIAKQVSELREVVRYMRNEKDVIETQLQSARRTAERERAAAEIAKRSLDQLRAEIELLQNEGTKESSVDLSSVDSAVAIAAKLKQAEDQLVLLRESNTMLRAETEKLSQSVEISQNEAQGAKNALEPTKEISRSLEVDKAALEAEKASLIREVDAWKDRVQSLVKKFHQIDPEEHANALKKVEESEKQCAALQSAKENAEKETASVKSLVTRLNKEMSKQRSLAEASKAALAKANSEKEALMKNNTGSADAAKKEGMEMQKAKEKAEKDLASAQLEVEGQNKRMENLKNILRQNRTKTIESQQKLESLVQKEKELHSELEKEKDAHQAALKELASVKAAAQDEQGGVIMASVPASQQTSAVEAANVEKETPVAKESSSQGASSDNVPPLPKVPEEGFNFVASKLATPVGTNVEGTTEKLEDKASISSSTSSTDVPKTTPVVESTAKKFVSQKATTTSSAEGSSSVVAVKASKDTGKTVDAKKPPAATSKPTPAPKLSDNDKPAAPPAKKALKSTSSAPVSTEGSLRDKLMKKKRLLEQQIGSPPAKRPASTTAPAPAPLPPVSSQSDAPSKPTKSQKDENKPKEAEADTSSKRVKTDENSANDDITNPVAASDEKNAAKDETETAAESKPEKMEKESEKEAPAMPASKEAFSAKPLFGGLSASAPPFKMFGSGTGAPMFGSASSSATAVPAFGTSSSATAVPAFGTSSSATAAPGFGTSSSPSFGAAAPGFGRQLSDSASSSSSSAFLNLKPPGSGSGAPLIFGTSTNIQLPTPSKDPLPVGQSPFGTFQSMPFGTNPFASAPAPAATPSPFGFAGTKKRALEEPEEKEQEDTSTKLARVEEETSAPGTEASSEKEAPDVATKGDANLESES